VEAEALSVPGKFHETHKAVEVPALNAISVKQPGHPPTLHHDVANDQESRPGNADNDNAAPPEQIEQTAVPAEACTTNEGGTTEGGDNDLSAPAPSPANGEKSTSATSPTKDSRPLRIYVSEDRMWYAAAGHAPDLNKVPRLDFVLLSIIAAQRERGIVQTDLTRISGQDKRSTPRRTQLLHDKGYIEKKKVQVRGQATSLCTLRKFISPRSEASDQKGTVPEDDLWRGNVVTRKGPKGEVVDISALLRGIFDTLKEFNIITHIDLKRKLVLVSSQMVIDGNADQSLGDLRATMAIPGLR